MSKFQKMKIADFCQTGSGTTPSRSKLDVYYGGNIPWVKSGELRESIICETEEYVTEVALKETSLRIVPEGALLLAMYGATVGRVGFLGIEATTNQAVCHIVPDPQIADTRYLFHTLQFLSSYFISRGSGGAQPNISQQLIKETEIPLPPINEQKRIAAILDQADALRKARRRTIERLNDLSQSIFYEMFGSWREGSEKWPASQLGSKIDFLTSGSRGWAQYYSEEGAKFIRIQNVRKDQLELSDLAYVRPPDSAEANRTRVQPGDVLLSITADLGRTAVIPDDIGEAYINQHLSIIRSSKLNPRFLSAALSSQSGQYLIMKRNREGVKAGLNFDDIRSIEIICPPRQLQDKYELKIKKSDHLIHRSSLHLEKLNNLFNSLQQNAFRGELGKQAGAELVYNKR